jgi:hypothetical protein
MSILDEEVLVRALIALPQGAVISPRADYSDVAFNPSV